MVGNKDGELGENKVKEGVSKKTGEKLFYGWRKMVHIFPPVTNLEDHVKLPTGEAYKN